jgi:hypothetical protein
MTLQAGIAAFKLRGDLRVLIQGIKDRSLRRIGSDNFDNIASTDITHAYVVVEVKGAWNHRSDARSLKTCLGKYKDLRFDRDFQLLENRSEISPIVLPLEVLPFDPRHGVIHWALGVLNRIVLQRHDIGASETEQAQHDSQQLHWLYFSWKGTLAATMRKFERWRTPITRSRTTVRLFSRLTSTVWPVAVSCWVSTLLM